MSLATSKSPSSSVASLRNLRQQALILALEAANRRRRSRLSSYRPYAKQASFHAAGRDHRERLFMAGNQLGKTLAGSFEWAMHLTGLYPDWWEGRRFDGPVRLWAAGETRTSTRDTVQKYLLGEIDLHEGWGTGAIPASLITTRRFGTVPEALDFVRVKHKSGGISTLLFKAYEQGRAKWQGETLHGVWFDEEPPFDIYMEGLTRTNATGGIVMMTFTPLKGMSDVVRMFLADDDLKGLA